MKKRYKYLMGTFLLCILWSEGFTSESWAPEHDANFGNWFDNPNDTSSWIICIDYGMASCEDRLAVLGNGQTKFTCPVLNGVAGNQVYSDEIGSNATSLGVYRIAEEGTLSNGYPCIRLDGLSYTNENARARGIVIHPSFMASALPFEIWGANFPLTNSSRGCLSVSWRHFYKLKNIIKKHHIKYIHAYDSKIAYYPKISERNMGEN